MSQVTVTDVQNVSMMETKDILTWISLHKKALQDDSMEYYRDAIMDDLAKLEEELELRNPLVIAVKELTKAVNELNQTIKEKQNGNTTD